MQYPTFESKLGQYAAQKYLANKNGLNRQKLNMQLIFWSFITGLIIGTFFIKI